MKPTVSIVIPVYDGGPYVKSTPADTGYHLDERTVHKGSDLFHIEFSFYHVHIHLRLYQQI